MSTVVLSNVPYTCQEPDIHRALLMYGTAVNIQLNLATAQAVVTMRTIEEAQAVLNRHSLSLLGSNVRVDSLAAATPPQHPGHHHHHHQHSNMGMPPNSGDHAQMPPQHIFSSHHHHQQHQGFPGNPPTMPTNRLRVVIEDCQYPINKDILVQMFSMVAPPTFVHCGPSRPTTFGSVEFPDIASAERAMAQFSNKSIYPNTCFLKLSYEAAPHTSQPPGIQHANGHSYGASNFHRQDYASMPGNAPGMMGGRGGARGAPRGVGGGAGRGGSSYGSMSAAYDSLASHHNTQDGRPPGRQPPEDATVIVSNVAETVPLYDLWVLLEVYGNVNSLRRQFRDVTNVVAQFQNIADARTAVMYLQHCPFRGKELSLKQFSGYVERSGSVDWNVGPATDAATRAVTFASGFHHRTKPSAPYNPLGRIRPDKNLFISNLTEAITNEELQKEFQDAGCEIVGYYRKDPSVAIVSLKDTDAAIDAIIAKHGKQVKERYLRVTFSRYPPGPPPTAEPCAPHAVATPAGDTAGEAAEVQPPTTTEAPNEEETSTEVVAPVAP